MHVSLTLMSDDYDAAMQRWAPCSLLNDIAYSDGTLLLPTIYSTRAGGGGGGLRTSNLSATKGVDGGIGFFFMGRTVMGGCYRWRQKPW